MLGLAAAVIVVVIVITVAVAASGGHHHSPPALVTVPKVPVVNGGTATGAGSQTTWINRADTICTTFAPQLQQAGESAPAGAPSPELVSLTDEEIDDLNALGPPPSDASLERQWLGDWSTGVRAYSAGDVRDASTDIQAGSSDAREMGTTYS